jgi:molecular chaperone GrpE
MSKHQNPENVNPEMEQEQQDTAHQEGGEPLISHEQAEAESEPATGKTLESLEMELSEAKDKYLRLFAEFDNFRRRTAKEKNELIQTASKDLMTALIPVLDDTDRAIKASEGKEDGMPEGVRLILDKLRNTLTQRGLKQMQSTGEVFNAELMEAVTEFPAPTEDLKGKVIDTVENGYYLNDTIIRYAKVVVGK